MYIYQVISQVELEKKLDAASREKARYKQQLERAMTKLASAHKKEKDIAKAQMLKEKRELEHMRLRYLAAEEKKVISSERRELEELKNELGRWVFTKKLMLNWYWQPRQ